jgi:hypothetical protein
MVALTESYAAQEHVSLRRGVRILVRGRLDEVVPVQPGWFGLAKWLISAWNPLGAPATRSANVARTERLLADLRRAGGLVSDVLATSPPDRSWVEDTVVVVGLEEEQVRDLARHYGQPAVTEWRDDRLRIVPTGLVTDLDEVTRRAVAEVRAATCPMRVDDLDGERCAMRGGPWTSGSIHAASLWATHRRLLLERLGCDACGGGSRPTLGPLGAVVGPVDLHEPLLASRYGGYAWR